MVYSVGCLLTDATVALFDARVATSIVNRPLLRWTPQAGLLENSNCDSEILY